MQVEYIKYWPFDDRLLPNGRGQGQVTCSFNFAPNYIFETGEAEHFKLGLVSVRLCLYIRPSQSFVLLTRQNVSLSNQRSPGLVF